MQTTSTVVLVRPARFYVEAGAAETNVFMCTGGGEGTSTADTVHAQAIAEFDELVRILQSNGVRVIVMDSANPEAPDSIFPNNIISLHRCGTAVLYPMCPMARRSEREVDIVSRMRQEGFHVSGVQAMTHFEERGLFLEGTGSLILDHLRRLVYVGLSPRACRPAMEDWLSRAPGSAYTPVYFTSTDSAGVQIYHTNVMMSVGASFAVVCLETVRDEAEQAALLSSLKQDREVIVITEKQMVDMCGNVLNVRSQAGDSLIVMSARAREAFTAEQLRRLEAHGKVVAIPMPTIEMGGGSARCCLLECFLPLKSSADATAA